jgi:hypothetical protein
MKAPRARDAEAWGNAPGRIERDLPSSESAAFPSSESNRGVYFAPSELTLSVRLDPGPLAQAIASRAVGALGLCETQMRVLLISG